MAYTNPSGATAPSVGDIVLVVPLGQIGTQEQHFAQVVSLDPSGVNATCRSTIPPNLCHVRSIAVELQFSPYTASQLRIGQSA